MGSQKIQGELWGRRSGDWASVQEATGMAGYRHVLDFLQLKADDRLLDIGCGTGLFIGLAAQTGAELTGLDASESFVGLAKKRSPAARILTGEMEELPFPDHHFDAVTGFNSFQYAASTKNALAESHRVLKKNGKLAVMIWGNKEDCEAAAYLKAVGSLLPPPPPGAPGPFALSENKSLELALEQTGFTILDNADIPSVWDYPDAETALKGLLSAGPAARAIDHSGFEKVKETVAEAIKPYTRDDGHVVYHNKFRIVIAEK